MCSLRGGVDRCEAEGNYRKLYAALDEADDE
jgi:hypothetical protein